MLVQQNTIGTLVRPFRAEYYRSSRETGSAEYYKRTQEVVLVQQSTIEALGMLCWWSRVL